MPSVRVDVLEQGQVLHLSGRLAAASTTGTRDALSAQVDAGEGTLRVDLTGLEIWDRPGLGVLVGLARRTRRRGRQLSLTGAGERERRLLRVARVDRWTAGPDASGQELWRNSTGSPR